MDPYGDLFATLGLPPEPPQEGTADLERLRAIRRKLVWAFAWAIPSTQAVQAIAARGPLVEIGAGTGYWAWLLRQAGADILAFDRAPDAPPRWTQVERGGPEQIEAHPERALFLCWPPMGEGLAADCLERYSGRELISIGETGEQARTGDARFRRILGDRFVERERIALPCWPGYRDVLVIYARR